ncbi:glycosyltransferase [Acidobacteriia bacterium AH_259_A11_L15]|nr:glycosyltransferase [Acidobacteriia bacterium AH_259_A11_L15]
MSAPPPTGLISLGDYVSVIGRAEVDEMRALARRLEGRTIKMVNSTAMGGGVAEILNRLVPLMNDAGVSTRWDVITGGDDFFEITKGFHNALHGAPYEAHEQAFEIFRAYQQQNLANLRFEEDFVVIHDPQPIGLIEARQKPGKAPAGPRNAHWIWRCHIDVSRPHPQVWSFLEKYMKRYDAMIISSPAFTRPLPIAQYLFYPSIDPHSQKNQDLDEDFIAKTLERFGIDSNRRILLQVSRFDRLKDPLGVIQAYKLVRKYTDCQLVLAGGGAKDDPEGGQVLAEVREAAGDDPDIHLLALPPWSALEINALQRAATIIIQKSLQEGFGLTVTEGLWKKKPVVASAVGGIPLQIQHKLTGMLAHSVEGTAFQVRYLLSNPQVAQRLGENGHEHVKENFLVTRNLKRYLMLFLSLSGAAQ